MTSDRHHFKLLHEHTNDIDPWPHQWVDLGPAPTYGTLQELYGDLPYEERLDAIGRTGNGDWYRWRLLICNAPNCKGRARYRADLIETVASDWDHRRGAPS